MILEDSEPQTPIASALVAVQGHGLLVTGDDGGWRLQIAPGSYAVTATAVGYELGTKICDVAPGDGVNRCDIKLRRVGLSPAGPPVSGRSGTDTDTDADTDESGGCRLARGEPDGPHPLLALAAILALLAIRCSSRRRS